MRILITGDRDWTDIAPIRRALMAYRNHPDVVVVHGAARGADTIAAEVAKDLGFALEPHKAEWAKHRGRSAGIVRNAEMVALGADVCLAFHADLPNSKGTKDCVSRARVAGIRVMHIKG